MVILQAGADHFYPRPPRGGRPLMAFQLFTLPLISIHALREEGDNRKYRRFCPPRWISIHALREEGDLASLGNHLFYAGFLSTPSARRATAAASGEYCSSVRFLSTPSARRATTVSLSRRTYFLISIHALREEGDTYPVASMFPPEYFYPRPPRGGRRPAIRSCCTIR